MSISQLDIHRFAIGFDERDRARLHTLWDEVIDSNQWSHGEMNRRFEAAWEAWNGLPAVATGSWSGGAIAALEFADVRGKTVLCPSNTFMATPLAILAAGGKPVFVDCNREDLCASFADIEAKIAQHKPAALVLVHIGGHIAFESERIAELCRSEGVFLLEDCAHAHGASWDGTKPGMYGDAGVYSFYATKTVSTGEGGVLVSKRPELIEFARKYRDYGKPDYEVQGVNSRMSEFTAAVALTQTERMEEVVAWKNEIARDVLDPATCRKAPTSGRHGLGPVQIHRVRSDRALQWQGVRPAVPSHHGNRRRSAEQRLGGRRSLVRPALLPTGGRPRMSRVLVTGGAGFIGSHVVDRLIAAGHEPRILDVRPSPYHADVDTVLGDMTCLDDVMRAMEGCDAVTHLAAAADVGEVQKDPIHSEQLNARGTVNVLEAARQHDVKRVVYASTIWVYSDVVADHVDEDTALVPPAHLYTATKLAGELYCRSYQELYDVEHTILRFGIPYGPRARPAAVIPIFVNKALAGEPLTLAGGGQQSRRFVYVEDLAEGVVRGLAPQAANRTYNLVSDEDVTIKQIAENVRDVLGNVELVETEGRAGDFKGAEVSGARAAAELDWRPETSFAEGLRRYVAWHREDAEARAAAPAAVLAAPVAAAPAAAPAPAAPAIAAAAATPAQHPAAAPVWERRPARRSTGLPALRLAMLVLVGLVAGALAAALAHTVVFSDPAAIIGTLALFAIPTTLIARIDWTTDRVGALVVFGTMVVGSLLTSNLVDLMRDWSHGVSHFARGHHMLAILIACSLVAVALVGGARRLAAARA